MSSTIASRVLQRRTSGRVAKRYLQAKGLAVGNKYQNPSVRIHRYSDQLKVTDLTDAGKRGKKVPEMHISLTYSYKGDKSAWFDRISGEFLDYATRSTPYARMKAFIKDLQVDYPGEISLTEDQLRGVDVEPFGEVYEFKIPLDDNKTTIEVTSSPTSFMVIHHSWMKHPTNPNGPGHFQDTGYHPASKKDAVTFYGWMKDNAAKLKTMKDMQFLRDLWNKLGVKYDYH